MALTLNSSGLLKRFATASARYTLTLDLGRKSANTFFVCVNEFKVCIASYLSYSVRAVWFFYRLLMRPLSLGFAPTMVFVNSFVNVSSQLTSKCLDHTYLAGRNSSPSRIIETDGRHTSFRSAPLFVSYKYLVNSITQFKGCVNMGRIIMVQRVDFIELMYKLLN